MKARFLDPNVGRFTSLDPLIREPGSVESINPYSYTENNPVNRIDPDGRFSVGPGGDGITAQIAAGLKVIPGTGLFTTNPNAQFPRISNGGTQTNTTVLGPVTITVTTTLPRIGGVLGRELDRGPIDPSSLILSEGGALGIVPFIIGGAVLLDALVMAAVGTAILTTAAAVGVGIGTVLIKTKEDLEGFEESLRRRSANPRRGRRSPQDNIDQADDIEAAKAAKDAVGRTKDIENLEKSEQRRRAELKRIKNADDVGNLEDP
jgi:hypothetical protein